eukprot:CAMPEP_0185302176 /NCGR_PEP_ID=MMETSP1363-20130426/13260_1 /TAXON_ID=38817 /ORGANISM="Gephyrocapsa oceanica, Strain RCC1303" /LENGTH=40 /DNA_ID= /DNA_START= /DNA_END= /DNA_ORIENTATION=
MSKNLPALHPRMSLRKKQSSTRARHGSGGDSGGGEGGGKG